MTAHSTGFQRPSCLQQSLKFLQPNLSPFLPAVNAPESTAVCLLLPSCCCHHHQAGGGPGPWCPWAKTDLSLGCNHMSLKLSGPWGY